MPAAGVVRNRENLHAMRNGGEVLHVDSAFSDKRTVPADMHEAPYPDTAGSRENAERVNPYVISESETLRVYDDDGRVHLYVLPLTCNA